MKRFEEKQEYRITPDIYTITQIAQSNRNIDKHLFSDCITNLNIKDFFLLKE